MEKCLETGEEFSSQLPVISAPAKSSFGLVPFLLSQGQVNRQPAPGLGTTGERERGET